jgi:hypothetical protein
MRNCLSSWLAASSNGGLCSVLDRRLSNGLLASFDCHCLFVLNEEKWNFISFG